MSQNSFEKLEEKILHEQIVPGEDFDRNLIKNVSLFVHVSKIAELYIPRFMGMFVNQLQGDIPKNSGNTYINESTDSNQ